jgi:cytochrome P450 family 6
LSRFTTDVIGSTAFGIECNSLEDKNTKFYEMGLKAFSSFNFFKRAFLQTYRDLARKLHMTSTNKEVGDFYIGVVRETLNYRKENPQIQRNDFMNLLINLKDSGVLTFNQIAAQSVSFVVKHFLNKLFSLKQFKTNDKKILNNLENCCCNFGIYDEKSPRHRHVQCLKLQQ